MPVDTPETRRVLALSVLLLDDESFLFIVSQLWQFAKTSGGFADKDGWTRVREACETVIPELTRMK